ncbi:WD repeat protein [Grosmannia clavigera kw1407]|uniref:WD repeat protein n=1 Tax=Grosmannia clavigera (strain kw1407 / UAMH 11150) TaxID=655863 RepID=F0XLW8_GROCL|nr:WD repeat protein [Grosmannia clavigera kw1407]EFX01460.1 WD repeat protein [Grosmannia clavigera kw1407]
MTLGCYMLVATLMYNVHMGPNGLHLPGVTVTGWLFIALAAVILVGVHGKYTLQYLPSVLIFFSIAVLLHNQMWPYNKDFGYVWFIAWIVLYKSITLVFAPYIVFQPVIWYSSWVVIVAMLGWAFRPDQSLTRFMLWAATIYVLRSVLFLIVLTYFPGDNRRASLFPFNLFSGTWRVSRERWLALVELPKENPEQVPGGDSGQFPENESERRALCERCNIIVASSKLITGSETYLTRLTEWHEFRTTKEFVDSFAKPEQNTNSATQEAKPAEEAVESPSIEQDNTGSKAHFEQALEWLQSCRESHDLCKGVGNSKPVRPKRMLFVSNGGENYLEPGMPPASIKLMDTCDIDFTKSEYVALSHCWGKTKEVPFTLLASNIEMLYQGIDFFCLSRNLQDAITATLNLGFSYIWIDSLCITQSDKTFQEKEELAHIWEEDWKNEAPKLGGVYSAAACTIASTGSFDCNGGCFHSRNVKALEPCKIGAKPGIKPTAATPDEVIYVRRDDVFDFDRGVNLAPLNTRGWVMQERLLSRRILHFGADMLYWECGCRSASELNHHGYTYKRYPEDFRDHYAPDMSPQNIETRRDLYIAEREGRGLRWHDKEAVRRRPPPPMLHPDSPPSSQEVWLRKRGFWKNVLKSDSEPWTNDESDDRKKRPRAGFRADFELLRLGNAEKIATAVAEELAKYHLSLMAKWLGAEPAPEDESREVGQYSYSQLWYNIIEPYSRCLLTTPTDKLVAIMGLQEEVGRATGSTYLHGLWSQRLATDLLWFAIDGPGQRLRKDGKKPETPAIDGSGKQVGKEQNKPEGPPVAPTWSWASIVGAVALDLMPENSRAHIELKATLLATIRIIDGKDHPSSTAIELYGPVLKIEANWLTFDGTVWGIHAGNTRRPSARFFPDVAGRDEQSRQSLEGAKDLVCLSALVLRRNKSKLAMTSSTEDVQGLVLRSVEETDGAAGNNHGEDNSPKDYVRIGYFTTSYIAKSREAAQGLKALKRAELANAGTVPVYTVSGPSSRALPDWLASKKKQSLKHDPEYANRLELLQDFEFTGASGCIRVSEDGEWVMSTGTFPELGRFQKSFQIDLGADDGVERGLQGSIGVGCVNVAALAEESHGLAAFGTSRGTVEFWDSRSRARVATLDTHDGEISALDFSRSGMSLATGASSGIVQIYDLRRPTPLMTKDLGFGYPVKNLMHLTTASDEKKILASDKRAIKIFDETDGTPWTTIEPEADINSVAHCPNSGMLLSANEGRQQHAWFIPMLGPAPKWCTFLERLVDEMAEEVSTTTYDNYKFLTLAELRSLSLAHLVGKTNLLRPYMHGYFVASKLYDQARLIANPYVYEEERMKRVKERIDKERSSRIRGNKKVKVNQKLVDKLLKKQEKRDTIDLEAGALGDERFKGLFEDEEFAIDEKSAEFRALNPSTRIDETGRTIWGKHVPAKSDADSDSDSEDADDSIRKPDSSSRKPVGGEVSMRMSSSARQGGSKSKDSTFGARVEQMAASSSRSHGKGVPVRTRIVGERQVTFVPESSKKKEEPEAVEKPAPRRDNKARRSASGNTFRSLKQ